MTRINTNVASLAAQHQLKRSNSSLQTSLQRLSSGLRINTGKDDPAGMIASEVLRAEIASLGQSIKNTERANNIIATADAALGEVSKLLNDIRTLVQASANKGALSSAEIAANQKELDSALTSITRIAQTTVFAGDKLLDGSKAFTVSSAGGSLGAFNSALDITVSSMNPALHSTTLGDDVTIAVTTAALQRQVTLTGYNDVPAQLVTPSAATGTTSGLDSLSLSTSTRTQRTLLGGLVGTVDTTLESGTNSLLDMSFGTGAAARGFETVDFALTITTGGRLVDGAYSLDIANDNITGSTTTINFTSETDAATTAANFTAAVNAATATTGIVARTSGDTTILETLGTTEAITVTNGTGGDDIAALESAGVDNVSTAFVAGTDITDNVLQLTGLLNQGGTAVNASIASNQAFFDDNRTLVDAINTASVNTGVTATLTGGVTLDSGARQGANIILTGAGVGTGSTVTSAATGTDNALLTNATINAETTTGAAGVSFTTTYEVVGDLGRAVITVNNDAVLNNSTALVNAINSVTTSTGVTASLDTDGNQNGSNTGQGTSVLLTSQNFGSAAVATMSAIASDTATDITYFNDANTQAVSVTGTDAAGTVTHSLGSGSFTAVGELISYTDSNLTLTGLTSPALGVATANVDVVGGALFQVGPNVNFDNQININIQGLALASLGRNFTTTGSKGLSALLTGGADQLSSTDLSTAATLVDQAISEIATLRGELGALQSNVLESNINSLQSALEQVVAAESNIRDADFASETASLTRAQILQQAGISVLSIANSSPQSVLALLQ